MNLYRIEQWLDLRENTQRRADRVAFTLGVLAACAIGIGATLAAALLRN